MEENEVAVVSDAAIRLRKQATYLVTELNEIEDFADMKVQFKMAAEAIPAVAKELVERRYLNNIVKEGELRLYRKLGQMIKEGRANGEIESKGGDYISGQSKVTANDLAPKQLSDLHITRNESSRAQKIAEMDEIEFDDFIFDKKEDKEEITISGIMNVIAQKKKENKSKSVPKPKKEDNEVKSYESDDEETEVDVSGEEDVTRERTIDDVALDINVKLNGCWAKMVAIYKEREHIDISIRNGIKSAVLDMANIVQGGTYGEEEKFESCEEGGWFIGCDGEEEIEEREIRDVTSEESSVEFVELSTDIPAINI